MSAQDFKPGDTVWTVEWYDGGPEVVSGIVASTTHAAPKHGRAGKLVNVIRYGRTLRYGVDRVHRTERAAWDEVIATIEADLEGYRAARDRAAS